MFQKYIDDFSSKTMSYPNQCFWMPDYFAALPNFCKIISFFFQKLFRKVFIQFLFERKLNFELDLRLFLYQLNDSVTIFTHWIYTENFSSDRILKSFIIRILIDLGTKIYNYWPLLKLKIKLRNSIKIHFRRKENQSKIIKTGFLKVELPKNR